MTPTKNGVRGDEKYWVTLQMVVDDFWGGVSDIVDVHKLKK